MPGIQDLSVNISKPSFPELKLWKSSKYRQRITTLLTTSNGKTPKAHSRREMLWVSLKVQEETL